MHLKKNKFCDKKLGNEIYTKTQNNLDRTTAAPRSSQLQIPSDKHACINCMHKCRLLAKDFHLQIGTDRQTQTSPTTTTNAIQPPPENPTHLSQNNQTQTRDQNTHKTTPFPLESRGEQLCEQIPFRLFPPEHSRNKHPTTPSDYTLDRPVKTALKEQQALQWIEDLQHTSTHGTLD